MKFRKFGQVCLALVVSLGLGFGVTSCSTDHTVGYLYVTGTQYQQISGFRIDNNLGQLTPTQNSPYSSGGVNPTKILVTTAGKFVYVLNTGSIWGDITAFNIDGNTGRLSLITNQQVKNTAGTNLTYFPVGSSPINFFLLPSGSFIYTIENGHAGNINDPAQGVFVYAYRAGQLTLTQNTPIVTNA